MSSRSSGTLPNLNISFSRLGLIGLAVAGLGFGGCSQRPQDVAVASHGSEYFPSSVYGPASRRVIADGQPVPRGGGQYLVGKPYTIAGRTYYPSESRRTQVGAASWYGDAFHGRLTANGEIYDRDAFTAASPTMPLPSYARVTNLRNHYSMIVRVNDRGPYASDRIMDVSRRVAEALDFKRYGTAKLKVEYVGRASLAGSDDGKLYATLRTNSPAPWQNQPTLVAEIQPPSRVASLGAYAPQARNEIEPVRHSLRVTEDGAARRHTSARIDPERVEPRLPSRVAANRAHARDERAEPIRIASRRNAGADGPDHRATAFNPRHPRESRETQRPPVHVAHADQKRVVLPPSRPMNIGSAGRVHPKHEPLRLRLARARDD